ncbi:hypothetical protein H6A64_14270 [Lacrimispora saccharolytica]|nr:hypothetical protein [Lacrimispora saccharolytica]
MQNKKTKYLFIFWATNLIGIAVALILESGLGCDPIGLFCDGLSHLLSVSFGLASFFYNVLIIVIALFMARHNLGTGTIVYGLLSGFFIDFYRMFFEGLTLGKRGVIVAVPTFLLGELCMSLAFAILMQLKLGMTALDAVLKKVEKNAHIPYAYIKIGTDILLVVSGIFMGGVFGIGTIISALVTGILVAKFTKLIEHVQIKNETLKENARIKGDYRSEKI